ncbi:hypothetical protein [Hoeflea sp. BAL378]|uniref:hypothetical protein n=1 Tax=Hoeflea sp. BAL378 TaxID=1547437 RepID=UPI00126A47BC|nr:hypothetical protein [Hoeflea sp. BAL378]
MNDLIALVESSLFFKVAAILNVVQLGAIFAFIAKVSKLVRDKNKIGRSRTVLAEQVGQLRKEIETLQDMEVKYEKIIDRKNHEIETFKSLLPSDKKAAHALLHEVLELIPKTNKTHEHGIEYEGSYPISSVFLERLSYFLSYNYLLDDAKNTCAYNIVSQKILDAVLQEIDPFDYGDDYFNSKFEIDNESLIGVIYLVWKYAKENDDFYTLDLIMASRMLLENVSFLNSSDMELINKETFDYYKELASTETEKFKTLRNTLAVVFIKGKEPEKTALTEQEKFIFEKILNDEFVSPRLRNTLRNRYEHAGL